MSPITTLYHRGNSEVREPMKLWEVSPRDGLQSEKSILPLEAKRQLVSSLMDAGLRHIEVGSFVRTIPQLSDTDALTERLASHPLRAQTTLTGLIFNAKGLKRAIAAGVDGVCVVVMPSETFALKNSGVGAQEGLRRALDLVSEAKQRGLFVRVDVATSWSCPYEGTIPAERVSEFASSFLSNPSVDEVALADTIGHAHPFEVYQRFLPLIEKFGPDRLAGHFHDTQGFAIANVSAAYSAGVRIFDSSLGGLGGCPFAPGAAGNLATEDLLLLAQKMGSPQASEIELGALWGLIETLQTTMGRPLGGRSGHWWRNREA